MSRATNGLPPWLRFALARVLSWLPASVLSRVLPSSGGFRRSDIPAPLTAPATARRVYIAPTNSAGQGWQWMRAAEHHLGGVGGVAMATVQNDSFGFRVDYPVPLGVYRWSRQWQRAQTSAVATRFTHAVIESGKRLFGDVFPGSVEKEIASLRASDVRVALLFHGSDIRLPSRHAASSEWSPFQVDLWPITPQLEIIAERNARLAESFDGAVFVSTPDLLDDVPRARWLPLVVEPTRWKADVAPLSDGGLPRVAHVPSKAVVKGSDLIDPVLRRLADEGVLEYVRVEGIASSGMPDVYRSVDIVLDQFRIGSYGVAACEAMAAGRIVVSHVSEEVREHVRSASGLELPIVQATADRIEEVLREIIATPAEALAAAARGVPFVAAVHDGRLAASVLADFLEA